MVAAHVGADGHEQGPWLGHRDDPEFLAREQRWAHERAAAAERFARAARFVLGLAPAAREPALARYAAQRGAIAARELRAYVLWRETSA